MTTYILAGVIVILLIALAVITFAWRLAVHDANNADGFILQLEANVVEQDGQLVLLADMATLLRDEAENVRQWRGEVQGND